MTFKDLLVKRERIPSEAREVLRDKDAANQLGNIAAGLADTNTIRTLSGTEYTVVVDQGPVIEKEVDCTAGAK